MYQFDLDNLDRLFGEIYADLEVPPEMIYEATKRYEELGEWLNKDSQSRFQTSSSLYFQGSKLLGTSIKPVRRGDDYDFDMVYRRDIKTISQKDLKEQVGDQLKRYIEYLKEIRHDDIPTLIEKPRCWTLK